MHDAPAAADRSPESVPAWRRWGLAGSLVVILGAAAGLFLLGVGGFSDAADDSSAEDVLVDEAARLTARWQELSAIVTSVEDEVATVDQQRTRAEEDAEQLRQQQVTVEGLQGKAIEDEAAAGSSADAATDEARFVDDAIHDLREGMNGFTSAGNSVRIRYEGAADRGNRRDVDGMNESFEAASGQSLESFGESAADVLSELASLKAILDGLGLLSGDRSLWSEDFTHQSSGWSVETSDVGVIDYVDGRYEVNALATGQVVAGFSPYEFSDSEAGFEAVATVESESLDYQYGVICRAQRDDNVAGYFLSIWADGRYAIGIFDGQGNYEDLASGMAADIIGSPGETNRFIASCDGEHLTVSLNGEVLAEAVDSTYVTGYLAFAVTSQPTPVQVHFDALVVSLPEGQAMAIDP